ncbi:hypothetical protein M2D63_008695 [Pseudomonas sp. BJa5]|uniref:hypothetical protein n=1 Tax=Pseudomonas sp. BJa5 TaxID=2936270 RepID=UPI00255A201C|nr:hypothetical protein [Pseudomonas sp. BGr12]MDL2421189.1 hypothetical protein [Pseudomonas sp. BGr12]
MLDSLRREAELPGLDPVHVRAAERSVARRCQALEHQARRVAKQQVAEARLQAQAIREQARCQGYAEGVLNAVQDLADALLHSQRLAGQVRQALIETARDTLGEVLGQVQWIEALVEQWPAASNDARVPLQLLAPLRHKGEHARLVAALRRQWPGEIQVEYQAQSHYRLHLGELALEFHPPTVQAQLAEQVLRGSDGLARIDAELDQAARATLADCLERWLAAPGQGEEASEDAD